MLNLKYILLRDTLSQSSVRYVKITFIQILILDESLLDFRFFFLIKV